MRLLVLFLWSFTPFALGAQSASPGLLTVYFSERPPLSMVEGQRGVLLEATKVFLTEAGLKARFIELPSNRILELLRSGPSDALGVGWFKTPDREVWAHYSPAIYQDGPLVALVNARLVSSLPAVLRLDALLASPLTLGLQTGASLGRVVDEKIRALGLVPMESVVDPPTLLRMIRDGRMDYTLLCEEEAVYLVAHDPTLAPGIVMVRLADAPPGNLRHLMYSPGLDPSITARLNAAIERVQASGQ